ncbi:hypothetical protein [Ralstonia pseudosolanacearum]|uniref:hypothetical protein n=1 Tax=Ralstonia pseudosolanacearum TaxID=1310165 RepID=UPI001E4FA61C|nr:hypothetical protein [Ralstonia pseudosolanacearum]MDD7792082.1 hypothetical protein [Ralstonia pseudosolanacearum]
MIFEVWVVVPELLLDVLVPALLPESPPPPPPHAAKRRTEANATAWGALRNCIHMLLIVGMNRGRDRFMTKRCLCRWLVAQETRGWFLDYGNLNLFIATQEMDYIHFHTLGFRLY